MSRPCASVPNHHFQPGGSSAYMRLASMTGSVCASQGANRPTKIASANNAPPMMRLVPSFIAAAPLRRAARSIEHGRNKANRRSCVSDPGIDHGIEHVNQRIDRQKEQHHDENAALDGGNVALQDTVDEQRADAGPGE